MATTRLAFISFAHGHAGIYCRALGDRDDVELVSCWDDDTERGQRNAEEFGIHFHTDIDALLTDASIDAVLINSETNRHAGFVEKRPVRVKTCSCKNRWPRVWPTATASSPP